MRRPMKRSRKVEELVEEEDIQSGSEIDSEDMDDVTLTNARNESDDDDDESVKDESDEEEHDGEGEELEAHEEDEEDEEDDEDDEDDEDEYDDDNDEEEEEEEEEEGAKGEQLKQLEKEYNELQNQDHDSDLLKNLKRHKDEDILKGQAVKNQKALWDKTLELRFLLQKPFSSCNRLPQEPLRSLFQSSDGVNDAYSDLINSSKKTLDSILKLQEALLENNSTIAQSVDVKLAKNPKISEPSNGEVDEEWSKISQMHSRMASFRDKAIDKWHRKTQVTTGAAAIKNKLQAFNQNISEQVSSYMRDPSKMIKGMQQNRSAIALFGTVSDSPDNEVVNANGDPELLDDSEFYQQLLKEFFETIDPASSETAFYALKRLQTKKRKIVDRRASKSRKIRYNIHEKIINFMAPQPMNQPDMAPKLFQNLFGLKGKTQAPTQSVA